jgi:hypothetical protein
MTRIVIHVFHATHIRELDTLFQEVFMNINDSATREDLFKLIAGELVITSTTRHDNSLNVQVVQGIGYAME